MWLTCFYRVSEDEVILYVDRPNICLCLRDVELEKASSNFRARGGPVCFGVVIWRGVSVQKLITEILNSTEIRGKDVVDVFLSVNRG